MLYFYFLFPTSDFSLRIRSFVKKTLSLLIIWLILDVKKGGAGYQLVGKNIPLA